MGKQILTFAKLRASEIEAKSLEICPFKSLKVRSVDQRPNSAESGRGIKALKGLKLPEFWPSKFVQSISQKEVKRRRAIWSQALGQAVADAAHWSSAPWDTMPAWGSACTGMIHWIRLFTLASGMSCIKCEMQSHCFDLLSHGAFFFFFFGQLCTCKWCCAHVLHGALGRYPGLQWLSLCSWLLRVCCRKHSEQLEETWDQTSTFPWFFSQPYRNAS